MRWDHLLNLIDTLALIVAHLGCTVRVFEDMSSLVIGC